MQDQNNNLTELLDGWLSSGRRRSPHTHEAYRRDVGEFFSFCPKPVNEVTSDDVLRYQSRLRDQSKKDATEYRKLSSLRSFFKYLLIREKVKVNPAAQIQTPKIESHFADKALSVDEVKAVIDAADGMPVDSLLVRLLFVTGARISEVLALTAADFNIQDDGGAMVYLFGKGRKKREVYIGPDLCADVFKFGNVDDESKPIFAIDRHEAAAIVAKAAKVAKVSKHVTPHIFRHSLASYLIASGASLAQVRDQLGHQDVKTTSIYLHATERTQMIRKLPIK